MQNEAIWYFSVKVSLLKNFEKLQFANLMSAAYNPAVTRDKHGKLNGQLPVQIFDFILNIKLKSPYSLNSIQIYHFYALYLHGGLAFVQQLVSQKELKSELILSEHQRALGKSRVVGFTGFLCSIPLSEYLKFFCPV